jgi:hypothetical protein
VRRVEDDEALHELGMEAGEVPRDGAPPVVSHHARTPLAQMGHERGDIRREDIHPIRGNSRGLLRQAVTAHVGSHHTKPHLRERSDLRSPAEGEIGKTMQQDDERSPARLHVMESDAIDDRLAIIHVGSGLLFCG